MNTRWAVKEKLGKDDYLVEWDVHETGLPGKWEIRAIHYKRKGCPRSTLLTSLVDAERWCCTKTSLTETVSGHRLQVTLWHALERAASHDPEAAVR